MTESSVIGHQPKEYCRKVRSSLPFFTGSDVACILRYIPTRPPYAEWIRVISAVGSALPAEEAITVLSAWSPEETRGEYAAKLRSRLVGIGIGSLITMAKQNGFDVVAFHRTRVRFTAKRSLLTTTPSYAAPAERKSPRYTSRLGSAEDLDCLAKLRRLASPIGLNMMQESGCLAFSDNLTDLDGDGVWRPVKAWLVQDPSGRNVSARRLDGLGWTCARGSKSRCVSGSGSKSWPVGLTLAKPGQRLDVVEGEGDLVALWHLHAFAKTNEAAPVGLLGSCVNFDAFATDVGPYIAGRTIQIFVHRDANGAGQTAAKKWSDSFYRLGAAVVRARDLSPWLGEKGKDLNDAVVEANASKATIAAASQENP